LFFSSPDANSYSHPKLGLTLGDYRGGAVTPKFVQDVHSIFGPYICIFESKYKQSYGHLFIRNISYTQHHATETCTEIYAVFLYRTLVQTCGEQSWPCYGCDQLTMIWPQLQ